MRFGRLLGKEVVARADKGGGISLYSLEKNGGKIATNTSITRPVSISFSLDVLYCLSADFLCKLSSDLVIEQQYQLGHSQTLLYSSSKNLITANTTTLYFHDTNTLEIIRQVASDGNRLVLSLSDRFLTYSTLDPMGVDSSLLYGAKKLITAAISTAIYSTPTTEEVVMNGIVILDIKADMMLSHFRAHNNCISALSINPTQTLIVSSSTKGYSFLVWEIPGPRFYDGVNQSMMSKPDCIYKLGSLHN
jgi:WD40 repeat protein